MPKSAFHFGIYIMSKRTFDLGMSSCRKGCLLWACHHAEMNVCFRHAIMPKECLLWACHHAEKHV
jgi:hypothetical protein